MKLGNPLTKELPLKIVGSTVFGRYPEISIEQTFNMIMSDDWSVDFAGYSNVLTINPTGQGRGIYSSVIANLMFIVIDSDIYKVDVGLNKFHIGITTTFSGDVFIVENNGSQIVFSDLTNLYVYNYMSNTFTTLLSATLGFTPGYLTFQDGRVITPALGTNSWRLSGLNNALSWPNDSQHVGLLQTKPDNVVATLRFPGRGNMLLVFGKTVSEPWTDVGSQLFPYQRSSTYNIDYGCLNPATIAIGDVIVCWLGINEKSAPVIMYTTGGDIQKISTDGIDFKLAQLQYPQNSYGFLFRQDGHLLYVITFPQDNLSYMYDFNTSKFFTLTDPFLNYFIAKRTTFFNNTTYFVSFIDGNLYELSTNFTAADYGLDVNGNDRIFEIPRIRIPATIRMPDQTRFITQYMGFTIEEGSSPPYQSAAASPYPSLEQRVDLSLSKDGGQSFGSFQGLTLNPFGQRMNKLMWWRQGAANALTPQFRFNGFGRFIAYDGVLGVYQ